MDGTRDDSRPEASWEQVATGFAELGDLLRSGFTNPEDRDSSTREELRQAWSGFVVAAQGLGQAMATTVNDPEIRAGAKQAFGSLVDAIGATVRDTKRDAAARARQKHETEGEETAG